MDSCITLASAGSGKTTMIVNAIGQLVDNAIDPEKILIISYTKNAVEEIIHRLPAQYVNGINCHTFHGFCWEFLTKNNGLGSPRLMDKRPNVTALIANFVEDIGSPWEVNGFLEKTSIETLFYTFFNKENYEKTYPFNYFNGQWHQVEVLVNIVNFLKEKLNLWTFGDLVVTMYEKLHDKNSMNFLWSLYNQWDYIFIDECQDFSPMQMDILSVIFKEFIFNNYGLHVPKRFFIFGDVKQSIFNFQGASLDHFQRTMDQLVDLSKKNNYPLHVNNIYHTHRLSKNNIDFINRLFNGVAMDDFQNHHTQSSIDGHVQWFFPKIQDNTTEIVKKIGSLVETLLEEYKPEDIMIIFRNRDQLVYALAQWLKEKNYSTGLDVIAVVNNPVIELIHHIYGFINNDIDIIAMAAYWFNVLNPDAMGFLLKNHNNHGAIEEFLRQQPIIKDFFQWKDTIINPGDIHPYTLIFYVLGAPCFYHIIDGTDDDILFNLLESSEKFYGNWAEFYQWLPSTFKTQTQGVSMETIYGSKGLQSKVVIMVDGHKGPMGTHWQYPFIYQNIQGNYGDFGDPEEKNLWLKNNHQYIYKEFLRLMYVATTRAKERLYIFGTYPCETHSLLWFIQNQQP
jgi:ATP-dependent exoDNAse (exonuclease V) beta subunit